MIQIVILTLLAVSIPTIYSAQVRVHCQLALSTQCSAKYKYSITGNNLNTHFCLAPGKICNLDFDVTFSINSCVSDFKAQQCFTKACYLSVPGKEMCSYDLGCSNKTAQDVYKFQCAKCKTIQAKDCPYCFSSLKNEKSDINQYCIGSSCQGLGGQVTMRSCAQDVDSFNINCACCMSSNVALPTCTTGNKILQLPEITEWIRSSGYQNSPSTNSSASKNEKKLEFLILFGILVIVFLSSF